MVKTEYVCSGNVERIDFIGIYIKMYVSVYFVTLGRSSEPPTVTVTDTRCLSLLFGGELDSGHFDALLSVE
jgi:hypothetical protein